MSKCVVCLSGGLDSAVLLAYSLHQKIECRAVGFKYGSKHNQYENAAAQQIADYYKVPFYLYDLGQLFHDTPSSLLQGGGKIPEGHYEEESMRQTVVPGRNLIFLAVAASHAESIGGDGVAIGVHRGDHYIYPDCRPDFVNVAGQAIFHSSDRKVYLNAPFSHYTKQQIVLLGVDLRVPFELTHTCYKDQSKACGKCGSCQERLEAFHLCCLVDPLEYESRELLPKTK